MATLFFCTVGGLAQSNFLAQSSSDNKAVMIGSQCLYNFLLAECLIIPDYQFRKPGCVFKSVLNGWTVVPVPTPWESRSPYTAKSRGAGVIRHTIGLGFWTEQHVLRTWNLTAHCHQRQTCHTLSQTVYSLASASSSCHFIFLLTCSCHSKGHFRD